MFFWFLFVSAPHASFRSPSAYTVPCKVVVWVFEVIVIIVIIITTKEIYSSCSGNLVWTDSCQLHSRETVHSPWPLLGLDKCFFPFTPLKRASWCGTFSLTWGDERLYILPKQWYFLVYHRPGHLKGIEEQFPPKNNIDFKPLLDRYKNKKGNRLDSLTCPELSCILT